METVPILANHLKKKLKDNLQQGEFFVSCNIVKNYELGMSPRLFTRTTIKQQVSRP